MTISKQTLSSDERQIALNARRLTEAGSSVVSSPGGVAQPAAAANRDVLVHAEVKEFDPS